MRLTSLRLLVQHLSFVILVYGGRFGVSLGPALPCFACPYVAGCGGYCYLMGLQGYIGFGMGTGVFGPEGLRALGYFALFAALVAFWGKAWCGWVCPFGLVQDWLTALRKKLGWREAIISAPALAKLSRVKYVLLAYLVLAPPLVTSGLIHPDFYLPFCNLCPAKALMPLFAGETRYLALDMTNPVTTFFSTALLVISGGMLVGMFFKERFFCLFCPLLALIHLLKPLTFLRLVKAPQICHGCGACRRLCPLDIEKVYQERERADVQAGDCLNCGRCVESCPSDRALGFRWLGLKLVESSRRRALGWKRVRA